MTDNPTAQHADDQDPLGKAREILDRVSYRRIDPRRIKFTESEPRAKGGQGAIVIGTIIPPEHVPTWVPEQFLDAVLKVKLAIKQFEWDLKDVQESAKFFKSFVNELSIMAELFHPNIARLMWFVEDAQKGNAWIISPWEENGNVREFLQSGEWDIPERISLIQDVVDGVNYLHSRQPPICHGDLKSLNILVNSSYRAIITDFGSARIKRAPHEMTEDNGSKSARHMTNSDINQELASPKIELDPTTLELSITDAGFSIRWTAPEVLDNGVQDLPSDMWAVGWICWEIITGRIPFEELDRQGCIIAHVIKGKLPAIQEETELSNVLMLCGLMSECWMQNPTRRIIASDFQRKVLWVPSTVPAGHTLGGTKIRSAELLQALGTMYQHQGNTVMAESHFKSALQVASRTENHRAVANALGALGATYRSQSKFLEAEKALEEADKTLSQIGDELGAAGMLGDLGDTYRAQSKYYDAEKAYMKALKIFSRLRNETGSEKGVANVLHGLTEVYQTRGKYHKAEQVLKEVHAIYTSNGNARSAANALVSLGRIRHALSRGQEAVQAFKEALEIFSRMGDDIGMANASCGLGNLYSTHGIYQEAEHTLREAHEIYSRIGNDSGAANVLDGLGEVYNAQSRFKEAEQALRDAHKIHSRIGNVTGRANALSGLGGVYRCQSRYQEAEDAYLQAYELYSSLGTPLGIGNVFHGLGVLCSDQHSYEGALVAFRGAVEAYQSAGSERSRARSLKAIAPIYQAMGQHLEAYNSLLEALDTLINTTHHDGQAKASALLAFFESHSDSDQEVETGAARRAAMLELLGDRYLEQSKYVDAEESYYLAQAIYISICDGTGEARELRRLGTLYGIQARYEEAVEHFAQARVTSAGIGDHDGEVQALDGLMVACYKQQKLAELRNYSLDAFDIYNRMCWPMSKICSASLCLPH